MKGLGWGLFWLVILCLIGWPLGLGAFVRDSIAAGHLLDWIMGTLCFVWLLIILKAPWDLYFDACRVAFEQQRSQERGIVIAPNRVAYIRVLRRRLGALAVGAHVASSLLTAVVAHFSGGLIGFYFAGFFLVSTVFRPVLAGYVYLNRKLTAIGEETHYPREDVVALRDQVNRQDDELRGLRETTRGTEQKLEDERREREVETRELRQNVAALGREFETTVSRLTDNQEVIRGIQAFVRLVAQSTGVSGNSS